MVGASRPTQHNLIRFLMFTPTKKGINGPKIVLPTLLNIVWHLIHYKKVPQSKINVNTDVP